MDESDRKIVILGKTGVGKSSVANTIFGEELFTTNDTANSETSQCQAGAKPVDGRIITLIDTPGFFDTDKSTEQALRKEILKCIIKCAPPGPHAFLIVFKVEKFTEQEQAVIRTIDQYFSEEIFKYATVLFTHGDQLRKGQKVEEYFHQNQLARDLLKKCGERCHVIDNKYWESNQQEDYRSNQFQVKGLLKTIDELVEANKGSCYTNEMLQAVEKVKQQEEELIRQSSGNMSKEEVTEQAEERLLNKLMIPLADIAIGVLLGALFGRVPMVQKVLLKLSEPGQMVNVASIAITVVGEIAEAVARGEGAATLVAAVVRKMKPS